MPAPNDPNAVTSPPALSSADATAAGTDRATNSEFNLGAPHAPGELGVFGPYRVVRELGRGGMGAVYLAVDTRLNRKLALKVMLPEFAANAESKERFIREAKAAALVTHDNVVTVYEADERAGVPYIAMQFLQGTPLDAYVKKHGALNPAQVLRVARETAAGLAAAHAAGLIHRDIKPGNLWLEAPNGRVKILDFGLARPVDEQTELTKSGAIIGTPAYMSPEQARGRKVDARADLFSLGAVLYKLATGRNPFAGANVMEVLMALGSDEPTPVRELNPNVPEPLAVLIHHLLAKNPDARPQSAAEVAAAARSIAEGKYVAQPAPPLGLGAPVVVVPVPVHAENSAFEMMTFAETELERADGPKDARRERSNAPLIAGGFLLIAALIVGGVVVLLTKKPVADAKVDPPEPAKKDKPPPPSKQTPDRRAAEWVLGAGGKVRLDAAGNPALGSVAQLPRGAFAVSGVDFPNCGDKVTDADLAKFRGLDQLLDLHLRKSTVTDAGLDAVAACNRLRALTVESAKVGDTGLAKLHALTALELLDVRGTTATVSGIDQLAKALPLCKIVWDGGTVEPLQADRAAAEYALGVGGIVRVSTSANDIAQRADLPPPPYTVTKLWFRGNARVTNEGLAACRGCQSVVHLDLVNTQITDAGFAHFANYSRLTVIDLNNCPVGDAGIAHLQNCTGVVSLWLGGTLVTDKGLDTFKGVSRVYNLDVSRTRVTDKGLENFAGCRGVGQLFLGGTAVTDTGLALFKECPNLQLVSLYNTAVTDAGLEFLKEKKFLTELVVTNTKATPAGVAALAKALPKCKIVWDGGTIEPRE